MEILIGLGVVLAVLYGLYASMIGKKNKAKEALSGIDVQLKQRSSLIPNILHVAKKYMEHERNLLEEVTRLRTKADAPYNATDAAAVKEHIQTVGALDKSLGQLMIAVENYPTLKADETMMQAMRTYNEVEAQIAAARRFYNAAVTALNNAVEIFPGNFIAPLAKATTMPFYETDEASKAPVNAGDYL